MDLIDRTKQAVTHLLFDSTEEKGAETPKKQMSPISSKKVTHEPAVVEPQDEEEDLDLHLLFHESPVKNSDPGPVVTPAPTETPLRLA